MGYKVQYWTCHGKTKDQPASLHRPLPYIYRVGNGVFMEIVEVELNGVGDCLKPALSEYNID